MSFSNKITTLRKDRDMSQRDLAKEVGVHYTLINRYEKGSALPSTDTVKNLAKVLGVSVDFLLFNRLDGVAANKILDKDLLRQFEEINKFSKKEKTIVKDLLEGMILKHQVDCKTPQKKAKTRLIKKKKP